MRFREQLMLFPEQKTENQPLHHWTCLLSMTCLDNLRRAPLVLAAATGLAALFALVTRTEETEQVVATRWGGSQKIFRLWGKGIGFVYFI